MKKSFLHSTLLYLVGGLLIASLLIRIFLPPYYYVKRALPERNFSAHELYETVTAVASASTDSLAGQVILLKGLVDSVNEQYAVIGKDSEIIRCTFRKTIYDRKPDLRIGEEVVLKGVCFGPYMNQVVLIQCVLMKQSYPAGISGDSSKQ
ncbi:MAG: hypothetical protein V2A67_04250 [Bacteroidota bacterium]